MTNFKNFCFSVAALAVAVLSIFAIACGIRTLIYGVNEQFTSRNEHINYQIQVPNSVIDYQIVNAGDVKYWIARGWMPTGGITNDGKQAICLIAPTPVKEIKVEDE